MMPTDADYGIYRRYDRSPGRRRCPDWAAWDSARRGEVLQVDDGIVGCICMNAAAIRGRANPVGINPWGSLPIMRRRSMAAPTPSRE